MTSIRETVRTVTGRRLLLSYSAEAGTRLLIGYVVLSVVAAVAPLAMAFAVGDLIGSLTATVQAKTGVEALLVPLVVVAACLAAVQTANLASTAIGRLMERRIDSQLRQAVMRRVTGLPTLDGVMDHVLRDDLARFTTGGIAWLNSGIGAGTLAQIRELATYLGLLVGGVLLSAHQWWWGPVAVGVCATVRHIDSRGFLDFERVLDAHSTDMRRTQLWRDFLSGNSYAREVRILGLSDWLLDRHDRALHDYSESLYATRIGLRRRELALFLIIVLTCGAVYLAVVNLGISGAVAISELAIVLGVAGAMLASGDNQVAMLIESALPMASALRRLERACPNASTDDLEHATPLTSTPHLSLRGVHFTYPDNDQPTLRGCDLDIRPGEILALVGLNGAGKTTVGHLVSGLYEPCEGQIMVDGMPLASIHPQRWARTVHTVHQDFARFDMSVRDNVLVAVPDAHDEDVRKLAQKTMLNRHVARLPNGWQTTLGEGYPGSTGFSGGQWQSLALTRALLAMSYGTRLLVLDEPTANLDIEAELALFEAVLARRGQASVVLISHRFATVRRADRIAVLDGGQVVECGSHEELIMHNGLYAQMYHTQAGPHLSSVLSIDGTVARC